MLLHLSLWGALEFRGHIVRKPSHLFEILLHSLEALFVCYMDLIDLDPLGHVSQKLGGIKFIVGSRSLDDLILFFQRKVSVMIGGVNVLDVEVKDFVVGNDSRVCKVVDSSESLLRHGERGWKHLVKDGHGVWNVDDSLVLDNLGHKVTVKQVVRNWHANAENKAVGITFEHRLHISFGLAVEGTVKVRNIFLSKALARSKWMTIIILEDATSCVHGDMNIAEHAQIRNIECSNDIGTNRFGFVILAPINIGTASNASSHENMGWLDLIKFLGDRFTILYSDFRQVNFHFG